MVAGPGWAQRGWGDRPDRGDLPQAELTGYIAGLTGCRRQKDKGHPHNSVTKKGLRW